MRCERCQRRPGRRNRVEMRTYPATEVSIPRSLAIADEDWQTFEAIMRMKSGGQAALCSECFAVGWQPLIVVTGINKDLQPQAYRKGFGLPSYRTEFDLAPDFQPFVIDTDPERTLRLITDDFLAMLGDDMDDLAHSVAWANYHDFLKARLPEERVEQVVRRYGKKPSDVQVELVTVNRDLTDKVHKHPNSRAFNVILGATEGFENARGALAYLENRWFNIRTGDYIEIPQEVRHGFTVEPGGILHFLSVQGPPIVSENGQDDFVMAAA